MPPPTLPSAIGPLCASRIAASASSANAWRYRIWCDGTYGAYLWDTLLEIAIELGGGAVGLTAVWPDATVATDAPATHDNSHSNVQESP